MSPTDSTEDHPPDAWQTGTGSPARRFEAVVAATLVACGLGGLIVPYLSESVGAIGSTLALALGLLVFLRGRVLARSSRASRNQFAQRDPIQASERTSLVQPSQIIASAGECLWSISVKPDGALERHYMSPMFTELTGYPAEFFSVEGCNEHLGNEPWLKLVMPEDLQRVTAVYERMASKPNRREVCEYRITRFDGEVVWIRDNCVATIHPSGVVQYDGILTDISASKRAEEVESQTRDELARIMASVGECLWSIRISHDGKVERDFISPNIEDICGYPPERVNIPKETDASGGIILEDDRWTEMIVPEDRQRYVEVFEQLQAGTLCRETFEYRLIRSDGETIWIRDTCVAIRHPSGAVQLDGVTRDITANKQAEKEQQRLEERIQQTQKLESIGILAAGVAHDFNNLLGVILGNADIAVNSANCPGHIRESLQEIETASQRASELCRELLVYSGRASYVTAPVDLVDLVREMEKLLRLTQSPGVRIENDFPEEIASIEGDVAQLRQLVMNLITNAVDSMRGGTGSVQISIEERWCEEIDLGRTFAHGSLPAGQYVVLSVSDTGCGMTQDTLSRIFDPFFTTKFTGRGLGLAAALGIVRGHDGAISVTSELGRGTRTVVYFPALATKRADLTTGSAKAERWQTSGFVLHVDDEDAVRRIGSRMLERVGFKVISVASGEEALSVMDNGSRDIRCVVLDLMMPGLSGADTLRAIRERNQNLPVLIVTGYGESDASELLGRHSATGLLAKPFTGAQLEAALRAALGE